MAPTVDQIKSGINDFLDAIQEAAEQQVQDQDIPLIGSLAETAGAAMFSALKDKIDTAIGDAASVEEVRAALDVLDEINATIDNGELHLTFSAGGKTDLAAPDPFSLGAQVGGVGFNLDGTFSASLNTLMNIHAVIGDTGVRVVDSGDAELKVWVDGNLSLNQAGGSLGFLKIQATDADPAAPEVHVLASIDLPSFDLVNIDQALEDIEPGFEAKVGLDLDVDVIGSGFVPSMSMNLVLDVGIDDDFNVAPPEIKFNDISIDVGSMFGIFAESLAQFADILDTEPLGTFFDLTTGPVPLIDDLAHKFDMVDFFDTIPIIDDHVVSLVDLAVLKDQLQGADANKFFDMLGMLALARQIGGSIGPDGLINLGDLDFSAAGGQADALLALSSSLGIDAMDELDRIIDEVPAFGQIKEQLEGSFSSSSGFEIPMLDDPTLIIKFLFNGLFNEDVDIVRFDIPDLDFQAKADVFFSILGPLGLTLKGEVNGHMDFTVGYDTAGLRAVMGGAGSDALFDGFYFSTKKNNDAINPDTNPTGWDAVGHLDGRIGAGAAFRGFVVDASITGGIGFGSAERAINAWFNLDPNGDGKLRFDQLAGCFIDANGAVVADVLVEIEVGFDPFSYSDKFPLISTVVADFDLVECLTTISSPPGQGLATFAPPTFDAHDLVLNTGDRAGQRVFEGGGTTSVGTDVNENLEIRFARDATGGPTEGETHYTPPDPNALDITGFGVTQRYGVNDADPIPDADQTISVIKGNLGGGNDSVVMEREISIAAIISGGAGQDLIVTGAGNDSIDGGEDNDFLIGNAGDDTLIGGGGNDQLEGGAGADSLDGGAGRDKVSYYDAATEAVKIVISADGTHLDGVAGDALGDIFTSIEYFVGTKFNDTLTTAPEASDQPSATLEGREGDDSLLGSDTKRDFLIGGAGADTMRGGALEDGTSYVSSYAGVTVDLQNHIYSGGDAEGDVLDSIEDVQGSGFNDWIIGDTGTNVIDGYIGDDTLTGFLGVDTVRGGHGNDYIYAYADGDLLDGGGYRDNPGRDTLSYELANAPAGVTVNLYTGDGGGDDTLAKGQIIVIEPLTKAKLVVDQLGYSTFENLIGTSNSDNLTGDLAANSIIGGGGNDTIDGQGGDDWLIGGAGADSFRGGAGIDWVDYRSAATGVVVALEGVGGGATLSDSTGDVFDQAFDTRVENIRGSDFSDVLLADGYSNVIDPGLSASGPGNTQHDKVIGNGGLDTLFVDYSRGTAGKGIVGGFDSGSSIGGSLYREAKSSTTHIDGVDFTGIDRLHVIGTAQADTIYGGQDALGDVLLGGDGDDSITSGRGSDVVRADNGDDTVTFGTNVNRNMSTTDPGLDGNSWFYLDGGAGIDTLNASFISATRDMTFLAPRNAAESTQHNLVLAGSASIDNFEILGRIYTGSGDDTLVQDGRVNNDWYTGAGNDLLYIGYGHDDVNAGFEATGLGFIAENQYGANAEILDMAAFLNDVGDTLILDYSDLEAGRYVQGDSNLAHTPYVVDRVTPTSGDADDDTHNPFSLHVNTTGYQSYNADGSLGPDSIVSIYHDRVTVFGSNSGDTLGGTFVTFDSAMGSSVRGDDMLHGHGGDDALFGETGDDSLWGDEGDDFLVGSVTQEADGPDVSYDSTEIDHMWGGTGRDTFALGDWEASFYFDATAKTTNHYGVIEDFVKGEDTVQLTGPVSNYNTITNGSDIWIRANANNDLVGIVKGGHGFNLATDAISAPSIFFPLAAQAPQVQAMSLLSGAGSDDAGADQAVTTLATSGTFTVEALNDPDELLGHFGSGGRFSNESFEIEGDSRSVGWFEGDPFGLGSGIVLSTGRVEDLVGPNEDGGSINAQEEVQLTFRKLGVLNNNTIYVADLTGIGIDVNSITLRDSFNGGGSDGEVSGFDLNAIALSHTLLGEQALMPDLNSSAVLPKLNVFDFTPGGTTYTPGSQRTDPEPNGRETMPDLFGAQNGYVNNGWATLGNFDSPFNAITKHVVSLGEGGSIGFDLTQTLGTDAPLYLYVAEGDATTDEELTGIITASSQQVKPLGDMSTDLGDTGLDGDTTTVTYHFTPGAGDEMVQFQVVLFSEELPEFAGELDMDTFKFTLNGVEIGKLSDGMAATMDNLQVATYAPHHKDLVLNAPGTGPLADVTRADAYTTVLTFTGRANVGVDNVLKFEVADHGDALLDSGVLVRALPLTGAPIPGAISVTGTGDPVEDGTNATITVTRPDDADLDSTVTVHLTPSGNIGLGENGAGGAAIDVVFGPGQSGSQEIIVRAIGNDGPSQPGSVAATVTSDDPDFANPAIPQISFDIVDTYEVPENSLDVFDLSVPGVDDSTSLTWAITGGVDAAKFEINATTGELSFVNAPDFEAPADTGADNDYGVVVTAKNAAGAVVDTQKINARVTDVAETSVMKVKFESAKAGYENTLGWYDSRTGVGGIIFASVDSDGRCHFRTGDTAKFEVATKDVPFISFFLIPDGGGQRENSNSDLMGGTKVIQLANGTWAVATLDKHGNVETDKHGKPNLLAGEGAAALFSETSKNAGGVDYSSSKVGKSQTAETLAGDTADGPTGLMAWEDIAATRKHNGTYGAPGDADYDDAVFTVTETRSVTLTGTNGAESLAGGIASDFLLGKGGNDTLVGNDGNDKLDGGQDADKMMGGRGDDLYIVDNAGDQVIEAKDGGDDTVRSSISYTLTAYTENLVLTGKLAINGTGNDLDNEITGNDAANVLDGKKGDDHLIGLGGDDTYIVDSDCDVVTEQANGGNDTVQSSASYELGANVENLILLGTGSINATGNDLTNNLVGNSGANKLNGEGGADRMEGKAGNDTYVVDNTGDDVVEAGNGGTDTVLSSISYALGANAENLTLTGSAAINGLGNDRANTLVGNKADNMLDGGAGADDLKGGDGDDVYFVDNTGDDVIESSNDGNDTVRSSVNFTLDGNVENLVLTGTSALNGTGNSLNNILVGNGTANVLKAGSGGDILIGGAGADSLYGGSDYSRDVFVFQAIGDSGKTSSTWDRVYDFDRNIDKLDFSDIDAGTAAGDQSFRFVTSFSAGSTGQIRAVSSGSDVRVEVDLQGDNTVDMVIQVINAQYLRSGDFVL